METNIFNYIESVTRVENLSSRNWKDIVDNVVLPRMAGPNGTRWCIHDDFMNFVAEYAYELGVRDSYTATAMLEIGLQRLSCGAVMHSDDPTPWPEPLPKEYHAYSSKWDETHIMTAGCYNFILKAMEACLQNETTRSHALAILFGLMKQLSPTGEVSHAYYALGNFKKNAATLFAHAQRLAEAYASFEQLYSHYAQPGQWQKHRMWFSKNQKKLNWDRFFKDTKFAKEENIFRRWQNRRALKQELVRQALPVAM